GVAHALQDHLLGGLGGDAAELLRGQLHLDLVVQLGVAVQRAGLGQTDLELGIADHLHDLLPGEHLQRAGVAVEVHADVVRHAHGLLRRRKQSGVQRLEEDLDPDPLLVADLLNDVDELSVDHVAPCFFLNSAGTSRALLRSRRGTAYGIPPASAIVSDSGVTSTSTPVSSRRPSSGSRTQQCTSRPTAQANSRSFLSSRSRPGADPSRSYGSGMRPDTSSTSPISRLKRWQSAIPTPSGLST